MTWSYSEEEKSVTSEGSNIQRLGMKRKPAGFEELKNSFWLCEEEGRVWHVMILERYII